jgi:hypothetical protein
VVRSNAIDEPITPTVFSAREIDQLGSADISPEAVGQRGVYVGRSGIDLFEIAASDTGDYAVQTLMRLAPDIALAGIVKVFAQYRPDPRVYCVLADGTMAVLTYNRDEKVIAWTIYETDGKVEDGESLPGVQEDQVYLVINRTIGGVTNRCVELQAMERETRGGAVNKLVDCGRALTSMTPTRTFTVPAGFESKRIAIWADGRGYDNLPVINGTVTLPMTAPAVTSVWWGLPYTAQFKSTKLAYAADAGSALMQKKRIDHIALLLDKTVPQAVLYGDSFTRLDPLPRVVAGAEIDQNVLYDEIDDVAVPFSGSWTTDARVCIQAKSPYPVTLKALVVSLATHDAR